MRSGSPPFLRLSRQQWLALLLLLSLLTLAWWFREPLRAHLSNLPEARSWLQGLGPLGAIIFIGINAAQIVIAPIPGYIVQLAGGWVFGAAQGALLGIIGLALGATLAMSLARVLGRPFVRRMIGAERLARWEHVTRADRPWLWAALFLAPIGDLPYFLAGLSRFPIRRLVLIAVVVRSPSVTLAAAIGAGAVAVNPAQAIDWLTALAAELHPLIVATLVIAILALLALALRYTLRLKDILLARLNQTIQTDMPAELVTAEPLVAAD